MVLVVLESDVIDVEALAPGLARRSNQDLDECDPVIEIGGDLRLWRVVAACAQRDRIGLSVVPVGLAEFGSEGA